MNRPIRKLPTTNPAMKVASTMEVAYTVLPRMRVSIRTQTTSYIRPLMPDRKNSRYSQPTEPADGDLGIPGSFRKNGGMGSSAVRVKIFAEGHPRSRRHGDGVMSIEIPKGRHGPVYPDKAG